MLQQASPITLEVITAQCYRTGTSKKQRSAFGFRKSVDQHQEAVDT